MRRTAIILVALACLTASAACSSKKKSPVATKSSTTSSSASPSTTVPPGISPLTGLPGTPATLDRPALIVKIDNAPRARPQAGINKADVVVEEMVEGGITRLASVFQSTDSPVEPVRSARSTDIAFASALHKPLFAYSGANPTFLSLVRSAPLVDVGVEKQPGAYHRDGGRPMPYNLVSSTSALYATASGGSRPPALFTYGTPTGGTPAKGIDLVFADIVTTHITYTWNGQGWLRVQNGTPHVDAAGTQVAPTNVVVQFTEYHDTGIRDRSNSPVPEGTLVGSGDAWFFTGGMVFKGHWSKSSASSVTTYTDASGTPMVLNPGRTWIELTPSNGKGSATAQ
ncbi:MAG: DUF3048 domain-containing protein [Actinobacteria bacterium]|nr:DUF3048 domain-containing protein [Actinomycetota bacterium]